MRALYASLSLSFRNLADVHAVIFEGYIDTSEDDCVQNLARPSWWHGRQAGGQMEDFLYFCVVLQIDRQYQVSETAKLAHLWHARGVINTSNTFLCLWDLFAFYQQQLSYSIVLNHLICGLPYIATNCAHACHFFAPHIKAICCVSHLTRVLGKPEKHSHLQTM